MDSPGLLKLIMLKRKKSALLREETSAAVTEAVDPAVLILDAVDEFASDKIEKIWACSLLVQVLYMKGGRFAGKLKLKWKPPEFGRSVLERAGEILKIWKEEEGDGSGIRGAAEAVMFLQMMVIFGLKSRFDENFLMKLVMDNAAGRDVARVAVAIRFREKMEEMIEELVKNGKEIEAVYLAFEAGLTDKFSPVTLIKSYLRDIKKSALSKDGNSSSSATDESTTTELNLVKAAIKCVEDHNLESKFPLDPVRKRATRLERIREERKKSIATALKPKTKRRQRPNIHHIDQKPPAKAPKFSTTYNSPMPRYSTYPTNPSSAPYLTTYGASNSQSQSPVAIAQ